jgi:hypothetical protein
VEESERWSAMWARVMWARASSPVRASNARLDLPAQTKMPAGQ